MHHPAELEPTRPDTADRPIDHPAGRDRRRLLPLWRCTGWFLLETPLHLGSGRQQPITLPEGLHDPEPPVPEPARHVATVMRDHLGQPCIPASSFKGALLELARRCGLDAALRERLFGAESGTTAPHTRAGAVEFSWLYLDAAAAASETTRLPLADIDAHPHVAHLPHVSRNRDTGAAEAQRLYLQQVLPPGRRFRFECSVRGLPPDDIAALLGLLARAGDPDSGLRLGAGQAADLGRVRWQPGEARCLDDQHLARLWQALNPPAAPRRSASPAATPVTPTPAALWAPGSEWSQRLPVQAASLPAAPADWLVLPDLALVFHSPFLVHQRRRKARGSAEPDGAPRTSHDGRAVLPASSLHGALRTQAERILRTLGHPVPPGYSALTVQGLAAAARLDPVSQLFGAPGWRSLLRCSDFIDDQPATGATASPVHHMLAIDRLTGGGKDSAKFSLQVRDCPTLRGRLWLDLVRLRRLEQRVPGCSAQLLGLLAQVLRDLDEGDIPLGYGASKGYGQQRSTTLAALQQALRRLPPDHALPAPARLPARVAASPGQPSDPATILATGPAASAPAASATATTPVMPVTPQPASGDFHNPYTFIPCATPQPDNPHLPWVRHADITHADPAQPPHPDSHARYAPGRLSGRLVCRLTTRTPLFIGAGEAPVQPAARPGAPQAKLLQPYTLNGRIALPATSLRGLLGSLHESMTASALRVMHPTTYSVRQQTGGNEVNTYASSAIGVVQRDIDAQGREIWCVLPLTLPVLAPDDDYCVPPGYEMCCWTDARGRSVGYHRVMLEPQRMQAPRPGSDWARLKQDGFHAPASEALLHSDWYLPLTPLVFDAELRLLSPERQQRPKQQTGHMIGQRPVPEDACPVSAREYQALPPPQRQGLVRGRLRVMACPGRDLPTGARKYELFIPYPAEFDADTPQGLPCTDTCLQRFAELADQQHDWQRKDLPADPRLLRPYTPLGRARDHQPLRLAPGDLVYFKPSADGQQIAEVSFSSIWRARVETDIDSQGARRPFTSIDALPDARLAPLGHGKHLTRLSPSELLFGVVETRPARRPGTAGPAATDPAAAEAAIQAYAGKLRFSAACSTVPVKLLPEPVTLKILSAPKPPSPAMYFQPRPESPTAPAQTLARNTASRTDRPGQRPQPRPGGLSAARHTPDQPAAPYLSKADYLQKPEGYQHQGRKVYLHALRYLDGPKQGQVRPLDPHGLDDSRSTDMPWQSAEPGQDVKQKVRVRPIEAGQVFEFTIDFSHLDPAGLDSLCATLHPHAEFEHKLGMGKPIGLGSVRIDITALHLIDRVQRYSGPPDAPRHTSTWSAADATPDPAAAPAGTDTTASAESPLRRAARHLQWLQQQHPATWNAIALTGHRSAVHKPVHYPQLAGEPIEQKTYDWFMNNASSGNNWDATTHQQLAPITASTTRLPSLKRRKRQPGPPRR